MKQILIVDDAATVRMYHRNIFEEAGYAVEEAVNGIEALEKALVRPFDLYVVDLNMPKMDGYAFMTELRSRDLMQTPAVMISNLYLVKPVKPPELLLFCRLLLGEVVP
jgi:two-component system chemotaxis response regulator CheY